MNPQLEQLYKILKEWDILEDDATPEQFVATMSDPAAQDALYSNLVKNGKIKDTKKVSQDQFKSTYFTNIRPITAEEPVKKKDGGEDFGEPSTSTSSLSNAAAPTAGIATGNEPSPGDLLTESPSTQPQVQEQANVAFQPPPVMLQPLTGDEDVQGFAESQRAAKEEAYGYRQKYDAQTPIRATKRKIANAEEYGKVAQVQRNFAADKLALDLGADWKDRLEQSAKWLETYDPKTATPAMQDQAVLVKQVYDGIVEHPMFKQWDDAGRAINNAYTDYKAAVEEPEYKTAVETRKSLQAQKDATQGAKGRYEDAQLRTGATFLADLLTLPRTVARSEIGRQLVVGPVGAGIKPGVNDFSGADVLGSWGDQLMEVTDTYLPKSSKYEQQVLEKVVPFEGKTVVIGRDGKMERVKDDQGYMVDVDEDFQKRFDQSGVAQNATTQWTGAANTLEKIGGMATDMALMIGAGGGSEAGVFLTSFAQTQGDAYREAIQDLKMTPNDAAEYAMATSMVQAAIESQLGKVETTMNPQSLAKTTLGKEEMTALAGKMTPTQLAMAKVKPWLETVGGEVGEEVSQAVADAQIKAQFNAATGAKMDDRVTPEDMANIVLQTALVSGLFGGMQSATAVNDLNKRAVMSLAENPEQFTYLLDQMQKTGGIDEATAARLDAQAQKIVQYNAKLPEMNADMRATILNQQWAAMNAAAAAGDPTVMPVQAQMAAGDAKDLNKEAEKNLATAIQDPDALPETKDKEKPKGQRLRSLVELSGNSGQLPVAPIEVKRSLSDEFRQNEKTTGEIADAYANSRPIATIEGNEDEIGDFAIQELEQQGYQVAPDEQGAVKRFFVESLGADTRPADVAFPGLAKEYMQANTEQRPLRDRMTLESIDDTIADYFSGGGKVSSVSFDRFDDPNNRAGMSSLYFKRDGANLDALAQSWANDEKLGFGKSEEEIRQAIVDFMKKYPAKNVNAYLETRVGDQEAKREAEDRARLFESTDEEGLDAMGVEAQDELLESAGKEVDAAVAEISQETADAVDEWLGGFVNEEGNFYPSDVREAIAAAEIPPTDENFDAEKAAAWDRLGEEGKSLIRALAGDNRKLEIMIKQSVEAPLEVMGADAESVLADFRNEDGNIDVEKLREAWDNGGMLRWADTLNQKAYETIENIVENGNTETNGPEGIDRPGGEQNEAAEADGTEGDQTPAGDIGEQLAEIEVSGDEVGLEARPTVSETGAVETVVTEADLALTDDQIEDARAKVTAALNKVTLPTRLTPRLVAEMMDQGLLSVEEGDAIQDWLESKDVRPDDAIIAKAELAIENLREVPEWMGPYRDAQIAHAREVASGRMAPDEPIIAQFGDEVLMGNMGSRAPVMGEMGLEQRGNIWVVPSSRVDEVFAWAFADRTRPDIVKDGNLSDGAGSTGTPVARFFRAPAGFAWLKAIRRAYYREKSVRRMVAEAKKALDPKRIQRVREVGEFLSAKYGITVVTDPAEINAALEKIGASEMIGDTVVRGFVYDGKVYVNLDGNAEATVHEFGHLWAEAARKNAPELWQQGVEAIKGSGYEEWVRKNPAYAGLSEQDIAEEALALAIGTRGALLSASAWERFMDWLDGLWGKIKALFGVDVQNMNAREFADYVNTIMMDFSGESNVNDPILKELLEQSGVEDWIEGGTPEARFLFGRNRVIDAATIDAARQILRTQIQDGADVIKSGVLKELGNLGLDKKTIDRLYTEEMRRAGMRIVSPEGTKPSEMKELARRLGLIFNEYFRVRGNAPRSVHERNLQRKAEINAKTYAMGQALLRMEQAVNKYLYGTKPHLKDAQRERWIWQQIQNVLEGTQPLQTIDTSLWDAIADVRKRVDDLSREAVMSGAFGPGMSITILANAGVEINAAVIEETERVGQILSKRPEERTDAENATVEKYLVDYGGEFGSYLYRSYRANDSEDWKNQVTDEVKEAAKVVIAQQIREAMMDESMALDDKYEGLDEKIETAQAEMVAVLDKVRDKIRAERQLLSDVIAKQAAYTAEKGRGNKNLQRQEGAVARRLKALEDMLRDGKKAAEMSPLDFALLASTPDFDAGPINAVLRSIYSRRKAIMEFEARAERAEAASFARLDALTHRLNNLDNEVNTILERNSPAGLVSGSRLGSKDQTVVRGKRKDIPEEIRNLLGEYRDPRINVMRSTLRVATVLANQKFLGDVRTMGLNEGWLSTKEKKTGNQVAQIAPEGSAAMNPLNGLWTTPEIARTFNDNDRKVYDFWIRWYFKAVGLSKIGKTILSPGAQARNLQSNIFQALRNGWIGGRGSGKAFLDAIKVYKTVQSKEFAEYFAHLQSLGVLGTSVTAGDLRTQAEIIANNQGGDEYGSFTTLMTPTAGIFKKGYAALQHVYRATDELLKVFGFQVESGRYAQALYGKRVAELSADELKVVETKAASIIRQITPDYDLIPKIGGVLRKLPITGSFISFPLEVYRNMGNWWFLVREELKDPKTRAIGLRRIVSATAYVASLYAIAAISKAVIGLSDDEESALNDLLKPWQKNTQKVWLSRDKKTGEISMINLGYTDPYALYKAPLSKLTTDSDQKFTERLMDASADLFSPLLQPDLFTGVLAQELMNYNLQTDKAIRVDALGFWHPENLERSREFLRTRLQPGLWKSANDMFDAINGGKMDEWGNVVSPETVAFNSLGINVEKIRPRVAFDRSLISDRMIKESLLDALKSTQYKEMRDVQRMKDSGNFSEEVVANREEKANQRINYMFQITTDAYNSELHRVGNKVRRANQYLAIPIKDIEAELAEKRYSKPEIEVVLGKSPMLYPKMKKPSF